MKRNKNSGAARCKAEGAGVHEQKDAGEDHGSCSFSRIMTSAEAKRPLPSSFSSLLLTRSMSKYQYVRNLMKSSPYDVEVAFSKMLEKTARKLSSDLASDPYLVEMIGSEEGSAVNCCLPLFCVVETVSVGSRCKQSECVLS